MYYVYVIQSLKDKTLYKGITNNLPRRLGQHNRGINASTKSKRPYELVYFEKCEDRYKARKREKWLKSGVGREYINKILTEY